MKFALDLNLLCTKNEKFKTIVKYKVCMVIILRMKHYKNAQTNLVTKLTIHILYIFHV